MLTTKWLWKDALTRDFIWLAISWRICWDNANVTGLALAISQVRIGHVRAKGETHSEPIIRAAFLFESDKAKTSKAKPVNHGHHQRLTNISPANDAAVVTICRITIGRRTLTVQFAIALVNIEWGRNTVIYQL